MHCPPDLLAWHNDLWLTMSVHDAKLYLLREREIPTFKVDLIFFV